MANKVELRQEVRALKVFDFIGDVEHHIQVEIKSSTWFGLSKHEIN